MIERDNCFIIQQTVNEMNFTPIKSVVRQKTLRFGTKLDNLSISLDICYVRMSERDISHVRDIYIDLFKQSVERVTSKCPLLRQQNQTYTVHT